MLTAWPACAAIVVDPLYHEHALRRARERALEPPPALFMMENAVQNGTFSSGLNDWVVTGNVQAVNGEAIINDQESTAILHQVVPLTSGVYTISFDFSSELSGLFDPGRFPDTFFASLYFADDASSLDISGLVFDDSAALMDMDWTGVFNNNGVVGPSALGSEWFHFSYDFTMDYQYVAVAFELAGINGVNGDSSVRIDNVMIAVVPEPATWAFIVAGGLAWWIRRRRA